MFTIDDYHDGKAKTMCCTNFAAANSLNTHSINANPFAPLQLSVRLDIS